MAKAKAQISTFHRWVLGLGLPFVVITPFVAIPFMFQAIGEHPRARRSDMLRWVFSGEYMVNEQPLLIARVLLTVWIVSCIAVIALAAYGGLRTPRGTGRQRLDYRWVTRDAAFWSLGDRTGWIENDRVRIGTVTEVHRRPFHFEGRLVNGVSGWPGLVVQLDDGTRVAREPGTVQRLKGTDGPSGTMDSIRDAMNNAVLPGDEFSWFDTDGELAEGVVVEKHEKPFTVAGKRVSATKSLPGYTVKRTDTGAVVGITNDLREVP